jgi:hypothetical protein
MVANAARYATTGPNTIRPYDVGRVNVERASVSKVIER